MLRFAAALCLIATTLAACGGEQKPPAAKAQAATTSTKPKPKADDPARLCRQINEAFEDNEGAYFSATALDYLSPDLLPLSRKLARSEPAAAAYERHAKALTAAGDDRHLRRVRSALASLHRAAGRVGGGCKLRPDARDVELIASPFYVNAQQAAHRRILNALVALNEAGDADQFVRRLARMDVALVRTLARVRRLGPPPKPLRRVMRRYVAAAKAYRSAVRETIAAYGSGSEAMVLSQVREHDRAYERLQNADIDVDTALS